MIVMTGTAGTTAGIGIGMMTAGEMTAGATIGVTADGIEGCQHDCVSSV